MKTTEKFKSFIRKIMGFDKSENGYREITKNVEEFDDVFVLIEASKLSQDDDFMKFEPKNYKIKEFKKELEDVIQKGVKDFYRPIIDPSFSEGKKSICFNKGKEPAVGKSYNWWKKIAKTLIPERGSRLGTKSEYIAFLGVLIKHLVSSGWTKENAWSAVCYDSKGLGHYRDSENSKRQFELTGSRQIWIFYDLANASKILSPDNSENDVFVIAGGCYAHFGCYCHLANIALAYSCSSKYKGCTGWIILEK